MLLLARTLGAALPQPVRIVAGASGLLLVTVATVRGRRPPSLHRQVDHRWLDRFRGWVVGAGFGFQLGAGGFTLISSYALYLLGLCALLGAPPAVLVMAGLVYGAIRGVSASPGGWVRDPRQLQQLNRVSMRLEALSTRVARVADFAGIVVITVALVIVAT